jgi:hypothetical protein
MYARRKILVLESPLSTYSETMGLNRTSRVGVVEGDEDYGLGGGGEIECYDVGGSSGRLTTTFGSGVEWSATGRMGASLLDVADGEEGDFSRKAFERCRSRMREMMRRGWIEKAEVRGDLKRTIREALDAAGD